MRVERWKAKEIFSSIHEEAFKNANSVMDNVVAAAKSRCPVGSVTRNPKTGSQKEWAGRKPGSLKNSIRRVNKEGSGNIRVYAGNYRVYYARFIEYGTRKMSARPFLRPAFESIKTKFLDAIGKNLVK